MSKFDPILPLTHTDAYKLGHHTMYPQGTEYVLSNFTDRGSRIDGVTHTVHFGLQAFLKTWVEKAWEPFFAAGEDEVADLYEEFVTSILGPNNVGSDHIRALHRLGYLPLRFRSLPEGALVPLRVPKVTVENTHPDFFWLTNYIETALSAALWHPATSATLAHRMRLNLDAHSLKTTAATETDFTCHDFSFRGMSGIEAASASGAGHLLSFTGSDSLCASAWIEDNYPGDSGFIQGSVPATEHSVATAFGPEGEVEYFETLIDNNPDGFLSVVSDSYDFWHTVTVTVPSLKDKIMARNGRLVIRPDSGDPVDIITGTFEAIHEDGSFVKDFYEKRDMYVASKGHPLRPEQKGVFEILWDTFGGTVNEQGYKVLDPHVGVIYGDSITYERAEEILNRLEAKGFAFSNLVLGVGSYTYQYVTRDTFGSAMKATWVQIDGEGKDIFKDPKTDNGLKRSARGRLAVVLDPEGDYKLLDGEDGARFEGTPADQLEVVWEDGNLVKEYSFADVRKNLGNIVG